MKTFRESLSTHPGVPVATWCSFLGFVSGAQVSWTRGLVGMALMSVFWIPVLITAWTGRKL